VKVIDQSRPPRLAAPPPWGATTPSIFSIRRR
jgi:hypothetical protein